MAVAEAGEDVVFALAQGDFVDVLADLTARLDSGRVYDRDLPTLAATVKALARREKTAPAPVVTSCRASRARHTAAILSP